MSNQLSSPTFLAAMAQLNQPCSPDRIVSPVSSLRLVQASALWDATSMTSEDQGRLNNFNRKLRAQIKALTALPEAERREKARLRAASRANEICDLLDKRSTLFSLWHRLRPNVYAHRVAKLRTPLMISYSDYTAHFCLTFNINNLPNELLTEIFFFVVSPWWLDSRAAAAVRLTHVCTLWQSLVIAHPRFWSPVCFEHPKYFETGFTFMDRARSTNLSIIILDKNKAVPLSVDAVAQLIDRLFLRLPSIRKLLIFLYNRQAVISVLNGLRRIPLYGRKMVLQCLEIRTEDIAGIPSSPLFGGAILPKFRHLCLDGVNIQWEVGLLSRLTSIDIRRLPMNLSPSSADFRAILKGASGLENMCLDYAGPTNELGVCSLPPIPIPTLRILELGRFADAHAEFVLSHFIAPNVLELSITFPMNSIYTGLITTLTTTCMMPKIKILTLVEMPIDGSRALLTRWFESMPELAYLRVMRPSSEIFEILKSERTQAPLASSDGSPQAVGQSLPNRLICPKLIYVDDRNDAGNFDDLTRWITHRRMKGCPLKKVWLSRHNVLILTKEQMESLENALGGVGAADIAYGRTVEVEAMCKQVQV